MNYLKILSTVKDIYDFIKPLIGDDTAKTQYNDYIREVEVVKPVETFIEKTPVSTENIVHNNVYYLINSCNTYHSDDTYIEIDGKRYDKLFVPITDKIEI